MAKGRIIHTPQPKQVNKTDLRTLLTNGINPQKPAIPSFTSYDESPDFNNYVQSIQLHTYQDILNNALPGSNGVSNPQGDVTEEVLLDEDNKYRKYRVTKDNAGNIIQKSLLDPTDAVNISDVINGSSNPNFGQAKVNELFQRIQADLDSQTGEFKDDAHRNFLENAFDNSMTAQLGKLSGKIMGADQFAGQYGVFDDPLTNSINFKEDGVYYKNTKLPLTPEQQSMVGDWVGHKTTGKDKGFIGQALSTATAMAIDAPLFMVAGGAVGKAVGTLLPNLANATTLTGRIANGVLQNTLTMELANVPTMINHTSESGLNAVLDDIANNAKFGFMAGVFGGAADKLANIGFSKLLGTGKPLQSNQFANFFRRNPKMAERLIGGLGSGALGYITTEGDTEDKLATAAAFASLHFATLDGWKTYIKGAKGDNTVMVSNDNYEQILNAVKGGKSMQETINNYDIRNKEQIKSAVKGGMSMEDAIKKYGVTPRYYQAEGKKLYEISSDDFVNKGRIRRVNDNPIEITPETEGDYKYLSQAIPFAKMTIKDAIRDGRIQQIATDLKKAGLSEYKNPISEEQYKDAVDIVRGKKKGNINEADEIANQYELHEHNKDIIANYLAQFMYSNKIASYLKKNELPEPEKINGIIEKASTLFKAPRRVFEQFIRDNFVDYIKDPEGFRRDKLGTTPEEYAKTFTSLMDETQKASVREFDRNTANDILNQLQVNKFDLAEEGTLPKNRFQRELANEDLDNRINEDLVKTVKGIKDWQDVQDAIAKGYHPNDIFEEIKRQAQGKFTSEEDIDNIVKDTRENIADRKRTEESVFQLLKNKYGDHYAGALFDALSGKERNQISVSGGIPDELKSTLDSLHTELITKGASAQWLPSTAEFLGKGEPTTFREKGIKVTELPESASIGEEKTYRINSEGNVSWISDERPNGNNEISIDYLGLNEGGYEAHSKFLNNIVNHIKENFKGVDKITANIKDITDHNVFTRNGWIIDKESGKAIYDLTGKNKPSKGKVDEKPFDKPLEKDSVYSPESNLDELPKDMQDIIYKPADNDLHTFTDKKFISQTANIGSEEVKVVNQKKVLSGKNKGKELYGFRIKNADGTWSDNIHYTERKNVKFPEEILKDLEERRTHILSTIDAEEKVSPETTAEIKALADKADWSTMRSLVESIKTEKTREAYEALNWLWDLADQYGIELRYSNKEVNGKDKLSSHTSGQFTVTALGKKAITINADIINGYGGRFAGSKVYSSEEAFLVTFAHEAIHGLMYGETPVLKGTWERSENAIAALAKIQWVIRDAWQADENNAVGEYFKSAVNYSIGNKPQELISVAMSAPRVAAYYDTLSMPGLKIEGETTVWGAIKAWAKDQVTALYGAKKNNTTKTVLDQIQESLDEIFDGVITPEEMKIFNDVMEKATRPEGYPSPVTSKPETPVMANLDRTEELMPDNANKINSERSNSPAIESKNSIDTNTLPENNKPSEPIIDNNFAQKNDNEAETKKRNAVPDFKSQEDYIERNSEPKGKVPKPEQVASFNEVQEELNQRGVKSVSNFTYKDEHGVQKKLVDISNPKKLLDHVTSDSFLYELKGKVKDYIKHSTVPIFKQEWSPKFREVYKHGERMIRDIPYYTNQILRNITGWNEAKDWRRMVKDHPEVARHYMDSIQAYEYGRYTGKISKDLTWDEFADWAKLSNEERKHMEQLKSTEKEATRIMKEMKKRFLVELDPHITSNLSAKKKEQLLGKDWKDIEAQMEADINAHADLRQKVADSIVEDKYATWGRYFHYNSIRPADPNTTIVEVRRKNNNLQTKQQIEKGEDAHERIYTYFDNKFDAENFVNQKVAEGWDADSKEIYTIKDLINKGQYWGKLNSHQIMELANKGHIELTDEVIRKLMEATKQGADLHTINKDYVPGMKYTPDEYEQQVERFVREAIAGSYKSFYFTKIQNELNNWRTTLEPLIKHSGSDSKVQAAKSEYDYSQKYFNQLKQPEKTAIDNLRGVMMGFHVGFFKPAFMVQQATQIFQTTLHNAIAEGGNIKMGTGDVIKAFNNAIAESAKQGLALRAISKDLPTTGIGHNEELLGHIKELELMNKVGGVGLDELFGLAGEPSYHYDKGFYKISQALIKGTTAIGKGVEKWTRVQTASVFYELGKVKGLSGKELTNYMADAIDRSMGEWGKGGRAPLLDSSSPNPAQSALVNALKKSFMTYKNFSFYNYGMWESLIRNRQWGALASKGIVGLGMHGITKFPLIASVMMAAQMFTDDDMDYEVMRGADELDKRLPMKLGSFLHRGVGGYVGLDLKNLYGEDTPLITDLVANTWSKTWDAKVLEIMMGAPLGFAKDEVKGLNEFKDSLVRKVKGDSFLTNDEQEKYSQLLAKASPVFLRNIFTAMNWDKDGITVRGNQVYTRDDIDGKDIWYKMLSFPVEKQSRAYLESQYGTEQKTAIAQRLIQRANQYIKEVNADPNMTMEQKNSEKLKAIKAIKEQKQILVELSKSKGITK